MARRKITRHKKGAIDPAMLVGGALAVGGIYLLLRPKPDGGNGNGECVDGETQTKRCWDDSQIVVKRCVNRMWETTGEQCLLPLLGVEIISPTDMEDLSKYLPLNVTVRVYNILESGFNVHVGCSMKGETGDWVDAPIKSINIPAESNRDVVFQFNPYTWASGYYNIRASVWDVIPSGNCEQAGSCHRLGDDIIVVHLGMVG